MKNNVQLLLLDLLLFLASVMESFDAITRVVASIGGIVVLILSIRKLQQDYKLKKLEQEEIKISIEIKEQELGRQLLKTKNEFDEQF